eukprot:c11106_g1_i2.p1 GENE.c11106_g1_i2~~c11106_g1_i2.p1  ORF type:complete len:527 (-),score=64.32 c11106_g1_i2:99-1679(-)
MRSRSVEDPAWRPHKSTTGGSKVRKPVVYEGVPVSGSLSLPQRPEDGFLSDEASLLTEADAESLELLCLELFNSTGVPLAVVVSNHAGEDWETTQQLVRAELRLPDDISDSEFQLAAATSRVLVERAQHFAHAIGTRWGVGGDSNWHNGIVLVMVSFPFLPSTHIVVDAALGCAFGDIHGNNILARNIARYIIRIELYSLAAHQGPVGDSAPSLSRSAVERAIEEAELSQRLRSTATVAVRGFKQHLIDTLVGALSTSVVLPPKSAIARLTGNRKRQSKRQSKRKRDRDGDDGTPSIASRFSKGRMLPCECWGCMDAARAWGRLPPLPVQGTYFQLLSDHAQLLGYGQQATIETMARYVFPFTRIPLAVLTIRRIVNRKMGDDAFLADALAYGVGVFNAWGLGHPTWNLGVLLLVVHDDHNTEKEALRVRTRAAERAAARETWVRRLGRLCVAVRRRDHRRGHGRGWLWEREINVRRVHLYRCSVRDGRRGGVRHRGRGSVFAQLAQLGHEHEHELAPACRAVASK